MIVMTFLVGLARWQGIIYAWSLYQHGLAIRGHEG